MQTFLQAVADDIIRKYSPDLSRIAVVFPNKRAALFLNHHLARLAGKPLWSPASITISELFRQQSPLVVADSLKLVCDLHKSFVNVTGTTESLDHFYGWGEILLADFDDIDKNMASPAQLFSNLASFHQLDRDDFLTDEQRQMLKRFFTHFSSSRETPLKQRFIQLWSRMLPLYLDYRERLVRQQLAYEGMLYRQVVESPPSQWQHDTYLFVGFNLLHKTEQALFSQLAAQGKARFYWDYDSLFLQPKHDAGHYIRQHLSRFPNELPPDHPVFHMAAHSKHITFASAATEDIQARHVATWLQHSQRAADGSHTAVVLCNERLLPTVIHCLPPMADKVNITTAYPLSATPVSAFVLRKLRLCRSIVNENPAQTLHTILQQLHDSAEDTHGDPLAAEALFRVHTLLSHLANLIDSGELQCSHATLYRLVRQLIQAASVPFHGEPAQGVQVMGVLETRNLDFDHLLILSCNEGYMPRVAATPSFIPHSLRRAFHLTTVENKVAVFAYHFHRLMARSTDITLLYSRAVTDGRPAEMSRFMLQMLTYGLHPVTRVRLTNPLSAILPNQKDYSSSTFSKTSIFNSQFSKVVEKDDDIQAQLHQLTSTTLTPTTLARYLRCPLQFLFADLMHLPEPSTPPSVIDPRLFGNIFHRSAQILYNHLAAISPVVQPDHLNSLLSHSQQLSTAVDRAIQHETDPANVSRDLAPTQCQQQILNPSLFSVSSGSAATSLHPSLKNPSAGALLLMRQGALRCLHRLLSFDLRRAPFSVVSTEQWLQARIPLHTSATNSSMPSTVSVGGIADRIDSISPQVLNSQFSNLNSQRLVIDYKTGAASLDKTPENLQEVFMPEYVDSKHGGYYLQALLYSLIVANQTAAPAAPALFFVQRSLDPRHPPLLHLGDQTVDNIQPLATEFQQRLGVLISEILNPDIPLVATPDISRCKKCPYAQLCSVKWGN